MGKNGNEHKQWCEELDGDDDENWGGVWFTQMNRIYLLFAK